MAKVRCKVCGAVYSEGHVDHGGFLVWEADLFYKGAGCLACGGEDPFEQNGPMETLAAADTEECRKYLERGERPEWKEPEPEVLWTCVGCKVSVVVDHNSWYTGVEERPLEWKGGDPVHEGLYSGGWLYGESPEHGEPTEYPEHDAGGRDYCPGCVALCPDCNSSPIFTREDLNGGSPYVEGASFWVDEEDSRRRRLVCRDCYEEWRMENEEDYWDDEDDNTEDWEDEDGY